MRRRGSHFHWRLHLLCSGTEFKSENPFLSPVRFNTAGQRSSKTERRGEQQLNNKIFRALGMRDTAMRGRLTCMRKGPARTEWSHLLAAYAWLAAGALRSTAVDMLRFGGGESLLPTSGRQTSVPMILTAMKVAQPLVYPLPNGVPKQGNRTHLPRRRRFADRRGWAFLPPLFNGWNVSKRLYFVAQPLTVR